MALILGDMGVNDNASNVHTFMIKRAKERSIHVFIHVGDIAYDLHTDGGKVGDQYMNRVEPAVARIPFMVIDGNHEDDKKNFSNYKVRFDMPNDPFFDNMYYR